MMVEWRQEKGEENEEEGWRLEMTRGREVDGRWRVREGREDWSDSRSKQAAFPICRRKEAKAQVKEEV